MKLEKVKMSILNLASLIAAVCVFVSCGASKTTLSSSSSTDFVNGSTAASLLSQLAGSYTSAGNVLDMTDATNILNLSSLTGCLSSLKGDVSQTVMDFKAGLKSALKNKMPEEKFKMVYEGLMDISELDLATISTSIQRGKTSDGVEEIKTGVERLLALFAE